MASQAELVFLEEALQQGCPGMVASSQAEYQRATCKDAKSCLARGPEMACWLPSLI